jgi:hypothetical protein
MSSNDLTNQALGDALGVSHAQVSRYRSGDRVPTDLVMVKIWRLTDWTVEEQIRAKYEQLAWLKEHPETGGSAPDGPYATGLRERLPVALHRLQAADDV